MFSPIQMPECEINFLTKIYTVEVVASSRSASYLRWWGLYRWDSDVHGIGNL